MVKTFESFIVVKTCDRQMQTERKIFSPPIQLDKLYAKSFAGDRNKVYVEIRAFSSVAVALEC